MPSWHCRRIRRAPPARGQRARHLGLAHAGLALEQQRLLELGGEEHGGAQRAVGQVALARQRRDDVVGGPEVHAGKNDRVQERRRRLLTLMLCCVGQFMVILDVSVVNVALPSIKADLGFTGADLQWVVNAYTLTFGGFLLLGGRAADLLGRGRVFAAGLGLFAAASLAGGLALSDRRARRRPRAAGDRRRHRRPRLALDPDQHVHRGGRAQPRARRLGRHGGRGRRVGLAAGRPAHRSAELALDPLHQRADRRDRRRADAAASSAPGGRCRRGGATSISRER